MRAPLSLLGVAVALSACSGGDKPEGPPDTGAGSCAFDGGGSEAGVPDLGPSPDLGPFVAPTLGDAGPPDIPDMGPDYLLGCQKLTFCVSSPTAGSGLTWANFGQEFFTTYCTRCHSSTLTGAARHGAPDGRNWDDRASVLTNRPLIRDYVGVRMYMPFDQPWTLPCERRRQLVTWIDEGAP